ncbi:MAG: helix-turn-helix transcriptional regulator [Cellulosilyticum sp.]|nr:helix-turn-helix transcriptional regulator [Cellulosilyticum sp.]
MNKSFTNYDYVFPDIGYFISRQCTADWIIEESVTNFIDITYVYEGEADYTINGIAYHVSKGDLLCIPKNSVRFATTNPKNPMKCYPINFQLYDPDHNEIILPFPLISHIGIIDILLYHYRELNTLWIEKKPGYILASRAIFSSILYRLLSLLYYKNDHTFLDFRIKKAIDYIAEHYVDKISVDDLASLVDLNPVYFGTLFKESMGCSVKKYINTLKINHAENLLLSGEFTVGEAAFKCGFDDIFYFSKLFKAMKGYPPSQVPRYF